MEKAGVKNWKRKGAKRRGNGKRKPYMSGFSASRYSRKLNITRVEVIVQK